MIDEKTKDIDAKQREDCDFHIVGLVRVRMDGFMIRDCCGNLLLRIDSREWPPKLIEVGDGESGEIIKYIPEHIPKLAGVE